MTWTALPITSRGRFSPFGPRGIRARFLLGGKHIIPGPICTSTHQNIADLTAITQTQVKYGTPPGSIPEERRNLCVK
jgi:hypothetical protein